MFQRTSSSEGGVCTPLWAAEAADLLIGIEEELWESEWWAPWLRSVPPRSGLLLGSSLLSALAKEPDRPRDFGIIPGAWLLLLVEIGRDGRESLEIEDMAIHI